MDATSFAIGFLAGVLSTILTAVGLVFVRLRRTLRGLAPRVRQMPRSTRRSASVETDAEGFILIPPEGS